MYFNLLFVFCLGVGWSICQRPVGLRDASPPGHDSQAVSPRCQTENLGHQACAKTPLQEMLMLSSAEGEYKDSALIPRSLERFP